jgi:hypothetical protein
VKTLFQQLQSRFQSISLQENLTARAFASISLDPLTFPLLERPQLILTLLNRYVHRHQPDDIPPIDALLWEPRARFFSEFAQCTA